MGLGIWHITQMPVLICSPELLMWQKDGSEHKPGVILDKAGSAGPEDLAVFTFGTAADANRYADICASTTAAPWQWFQTELILQAL